MPLTRLVANLLHPAQYLRSRIDDWVMRRVRRQRGPVAITRNRVYIVPTRFGWGYGLLCVLMLLGAMNYSNSMAFALTFLLFGLWLVSMHHTHANLVNLQLRMGRVQDCHAGGSAHFEIFADNPAAQARYAIGVQWIDHDGLQCTVDVPAQGFQTLLLPLPAARRGRLPAGVFAVSTEFPLGLFHAWTWAELDMEALVYPAPAPPGAQPPASSGGSGVDSGSRSGQDEFAGLRSYRRGDALHSIHWKSLPKTRQPMVKQFSDTVEHTLWLDYDAVPASTVEARLSRLARWVLDADADGRAYGLRLPGRRIAPQTGPSHRQACLRALALFEPGAP